MGSTFLPCGFEELRQNKVKAKRAEDQKHLCLSHVLLQMNLKQIHANLFISLRAEDLCMQSTYLLVLQSEELLRVT